MYKRQGSGIFVPSGRYTTICYGRERRSINLVFSLFHSFWFSLVMLTIQSVPGKYCLFLLFNSTFQHCIKMCRHALCVGPCMGSNACMRTAWSKRQRQRYPRPKAARPRSAGRVAVLISVSMAFSRQFARRELDACGAGAHPPSGENNDTHCRAFPRAQAQEYFLMCL